ncbi:hydrogenase maturation nickel metallochaperone HypA [Acetivibrio ethanolgignens]|uniref:Hydrogenase maturation factor HypA n=1 Tax=Acetivibrio ethanolgignens TaxID=290052 RepID=A0A0V8QDB0_9FIRM|nr:hydrogenase maturation nickel metallochaperone HypA [Acetivibrio ethanolgignens]KSV58575.1 hydrogenase nickel incorporation protein HypA [Acetivibrio ethanolgignens]
MHELGVVFHVIKTVEGLAAENQLTEVKSVTLEIGEVSTVIEEYLRKCWKWSVEKKSEILKDTELIVERIPAITFCEDCEKNYRTVEFGKTCPHCGSINTYLLQGNEFTIKEIEAC